MKICTTCGESKSLDLFPRSNRSKDGCQSLCKVCKSISTKAWKEKNKERIRLARQAHYEANKDKQLSQSNAWKEANREHVNDYAREWAKNNPAKRCEAEMRRHIAKIRRTPVWLTQEDKQAVIVIYEEARRLTVETGIPHEVDHIIPLQGKLVSGLHVPSNLQILIKSDNASKGNRYIV